MNVPKVESIDFNTLYKILSSNKITEVEKKDFIKQNRVEISKAVKIKISRTDYKKIMQKRNLKKFRPLKNCFTKKGDKLILANALNITPAAVAEYVKSAREQINSVKKVDFLGPEKMDMLKTYVYRHGSKDDLVDFLDYELSKTEDLIKTLYRTLEYYSGGVADYFIRPIHRMDNNTLIKLFNVIDKNIKQNQIEGRLSEASGQEIAMYALTRIYEIQNNSKLINAIKTYKTLK